MRIPPTTIHSTKNGRVLRDLLEEIRTERFTGHCEVTLDTVTRSLIFSDGICVLAETPRAKGREAYNELRALGDREIRAILYALSPSQVTVSVRFNENCRLGEENAAKKQPGTAFSTTIIKPVSSRGQPGKVVQIKTVQQMDERAETHPEKTVRSGEHGSPVRNAAGETVGDRISLDSIKGLKESFQFDAASLLKELDLEHLIVESKEPANQKKPIGSPEKDKC
ncbi:MAG: hypothetical protein LUQ40_03375 [Methanomicrobiales archaeon]|nr:hypothetical protein [Methanomicrobiales archaeon]